MPDFERQRWYYDACTLDENKMTYAEIIQKKHPKDAFLSHLSIGEAYGRCCEKGEEQAVAFSELIGKLRRYIHIVNNDGIEAVLVRIREEFPRLSITDAMHLATAIANKCSVFRTTDRDLYLLNKKKVRDLGREFGISQFAISKMVGDGR